MQQTVLLHREAVFASIIPSGQLSQLIDRMGMWRKRRRTHIVATDAQFGVVPGLDRGDETMQPSQIARLNVRMARAAIGLTGMG